MNTTCHRRFTTCLAAGFMMLLVVGGDRSSQTIAQQAEVETGSQQPSPATDSWFTHKAQWHGFDQFHFRIAGRDAYLIVPATPLDGKPWIWRARFPDYHAEIDIELIRQGYHLGYLNVADQFGSPEIVERASAFYRYLVDQRGLNPTPALEGVSRGGLLVYNWAAANRDSVACIYCDTPVLDIRSWPGGKGAGIGSEAAWKKCLGAYGLTEDQAAQFNQQPIDKAGILAKAKIPILHIVSENARVVPPSENTYRLREELKKFGHDMAVISVAQGTEKSSGHHFDHPDPRRVIEFIRRHAEAKSPIK